MSRLPGVHGTALALAAIGCLIGGAAARAAPSADEIIAHNIAARGGAERLKELGNLRRSGRLLIPGFNIELTIVQLQSRAGEIRIEATLQGLTAIDAFDGREGWRVQPFQGRKDPERMAADEAHALALSAEIAGPYVDYKAKGHTVEYLGLEDVDGTPAHKLRVHLKWGDEAIYWIDPDTWMVIRELDKRIVRGAEDLTEIDYGEYEQVAGVWVAMVIEEGAKDSDAARKQKTVFDRAEANVAVAPDYFAFPQNAPKKVAEVRP